MVSFRLRILRHAQSPRGSQSAFEDIFSTAVEADVGHAYASSATRDGQEHVRRFTDGCGLSLRVDQVAV